MSSLEKIAKGLEALKNAISSSHLPEEYLSRSKEKVNLCILVTDLICSHEIKSSSSFLSHLSASMEVLFTMCNDQDANVRMVADECLNRIIRTLMDGHIAKVNVELHAEMKRNRNARSLRAALVKFGELSKTIRPNKRQVFMHSIVGLLKTIAKRQEESVLETLSSSMGKFLVPLGCFLTESETKDLLQVFMENIWSEKAVFRRTAASSILAICLNCSKSQFFIVHTVNTLLEKVIPVKDDQNVYLILGVLNCIRGLLGHLDRLNTETGLRGSFGLKRKSKKDTVLSVDSVIQIFELCLHWSQHSDHNVVVAALEALNELLTSPPPQLVPILLSHQGLTRSRIHSSHPGWKLSSKTLSDLSVATPVHQAEDLLSFLEEDDPLGRASLSKWLEDNSLTGSLASVSAGLERSGPPSICHDSIQDFPDTESVMSEDFAPSLAAKSVTSATPENELDFSRESPSPPPQLAPTLTWEIGELTDSNMSPLLFTARRLVTSFLIPECGSVRVSVRSLALTCLTQIVKLSPTIFFQQVDKNGLSTPKGFSHVCDVLCFGNHSDQQLRGLSRLLVGNCIHSLFLLGNYGPQFCCDPSTKNVPIEDLVNILVLGILDETSICVGHSLSALTLCLPDIMDSCHFLLAGNILNKLLSVAQNSYWLVKVKLLELISSLPFQCVYHITGSMDYQDKIISLIINEFLTNEDSRVRKTTCEGIVKLVKNLYFSVDYNTGDVVVARGISLSSKMFSDAFKSDLQLSPYDAAVEGTLVRVLNALVEALVLSSSKHLSYGCIEALCNLSEAYPPSFYPLSWQCCDNEKSELMPSGGLFSMVVSLLTDTTVLFDLDCHQWLLKLASNLFIGLLPFLDKNKLSHENSKLKISIDGLLTHAIKLMHIFARVIEENSPSKSMLASPRKKKGLRSASPSKTSTPEKEVDKDSKAKQTNLIDSDPHYVRLFGILQTGYNHFKLTLDNSASEKFLLLLRHTLECLEVVLSPNKVIDSESIFEELLHYLQSTYSLGGEYTVKVVYQLLRSLFETNLIGVKTSSVGRDHLLFERQEISCGFYKNVFVDPLQKLEKQCDVSNLDLKGKYEKEEKERLPLTENEKEMLRLRIKSFEGIVIQSLREYTSTCNICLQAQVLNLLTLLVQLKVNYCLLDSDQVFIKFVLSQFQYLEAGQIHNPELLIPSIFNFLVHLADEKSHSKPVINMPKIIQLCDGLMASGQNPVTHSIPALLPVVEYVFFRSSESDTKELETQKEFVLAMLLRLVEYPQVLETVYNLLKAGRKWEEHWSRWYKQTIDAIIPLLADGRLLSSDTSALHSLFCLNKNLTAPLSSVLVLLFSPQQEGQTLSQWLGMVTVMLLSICMYDEAEMLVQLEELNLYVREEGDDPLKVRPVSKTLQPQCLLAKLLLRVILTSSSKLEQLIQSSNREESISDLGKNFSQFLLCCVLFLQPERFPNVSLSLSSLIKTSEDLKDLKSSFLVISFQYEIVVLLWEQILHLLDLTKQHSFITTISQKSKSRLSLNEEFLRRGIIMVYAEFLSKRPDDIESLTWFLSNFIEDVIWHCHEPPIEKFLTSIYILVPNSKVFIESLSCCKKKMETVFIHRLLHTLEYIHSDLSAAVLKLVALTLIKCTNIAIARLAAAFSCRTVEFILASDNPNVKTQLEEKDLRSIFNSLSSNKRLFRRHNNLIILLNKLGKQNYNISLCEFDDCVKPISHDPVSSVKIDKFWFFTLTQEKCAKQSDCDTRKCAYLLSKLDFNDIQKIMTSNDFNLNILEHCFSPEKSLTLEVIGDEISKEHSNSPLYLCAKSVLFKKINGLCQELPQNYDVFDPDACLNSELFDIFSSKEFLDSVLSITPALRNYLSSLETVLFEKHECQFLSRFGVLCAEIIRWIIFQMPRYDLNHWPSVTQNLLECSAAVFKIDSFSGNLTFEHISSVCSALIMLLKFVGGEDIAIKEYKHNDLEESSSPSIVLKVALQITSIISFIESRPKNIPNFIFQNARSITIYLSRNHKLNWLCRIPIEVWQPPLDSPTPPAIPIHELHDSEILSKIVSRIHLLGWRNKFQFEESWVCLLSALSPNPDIDNTAQEEMSAIMQANSLAMEGITWLVISTLYNNDSEYIHIPRHSNEVLYSLKFWERLAHLNDIFCFKLKRYCLNEGLKLSKIDKRPNLERPDAYQKYGIGQMSVSYLQSQIKSIDETVDLTSENESGPPEGRNIESLPKMISPEENVVDIRSCVQFILDLFSQWVLPNSGVTTNLKITMVKSILYISDLFLDRNHFEWMLNVFLDMSKNQSSNNEIIHFYLVVGIAKSCAVLNHFVGEKGEQVLKVVEAALRNPSQPIQEAGIHGLLYILQSLKDIKPVSEDSEPPKFKPHEFKQRIIELSLECIDTNVIKEKSLSCSMSLLSISLSFYLLEYFQSEITNFQDIVNSLMRIVKSSGNGKTYQSILNGFERLILVGSAALNDQVTRLALDRFSQTDPRVTIPALQLLLSCIYADPKNNFEDKKDSEPWTIEIMEKVTALFDRIKKGYPIEVEVVCDILPGILSDFFSASDILTKVIGEFLSPNQPYKRNMAAIVFQVFSQACKEEQLSLLQDWVVYSLNNLTHNLPLMMSGWSLCCFFLSASTNPWLKAIFPLVQSRIRQCEYEDRQILCLAAVDFYSQLNPKQQEIFMQSMKNAASGSHSLYSDIIACL